MKSRELLCSLSQNYSHNEHCQKVAIHVIGVWAVTRVEWLWCHCFGRIHLYELLLNCSDIDKDASLMQVYPHCFLTGCKILCTCANVTMYTKAGKGSTLSLWLWQPLCKSHPTVICMAYYWKKNIEELKKMQKIKIPEQYFFVLTVRDWKGLAIGGSDNNLLNINMQVELAIRKGSGIARGLHWALVRPLTENLCRVSLPEEWLHCDWERAGYVHPWDEENSGI